MNAPAKKKLFLYAGDEWKYDQGGVVTIVRAFYGLESSDLVWRNSLLDILVNHLGFQSSLADPYVCFKSETEKTGNEYYTYILVYVDHFLIVDKYP